MGYANAMSVYTSWAHLGHREVRLLAYMALVSRDDARPPVYFGGWQAAARAMGLDPEGKARSAQEVTRKAFGILAEAGAVVSSGKAHTGRRTEWALTLDPARSAAPTGSARDGNGRIVTTWTTLDRATGNPVGKSRRIWESPNGSLDHSPNRALGHKPQRIVGKSPNTALGPMRTDEPHQEYGEENIIPGGDSSTPASADVRGAAVFLARQPDQGRAALADMMANRGSLSESDMVLIAARMAGWAPEAEEVPA